jgi:predicted ABC-type ATPase
MDLSLQKENNMPNLIIIAGPNGSGKSTFSRILVDSFTKVNDTYIWDVDLEYFLFRANHSKTNGSTSLEYISDEYISTELIAKFESIKTNCINNKLHFAIETNLYPDDCHDLINEFKSKGYSIVMFFITLPTSEYCFDRVLMRSK